MRKITLNVLLLVAAFAIMPGCSTAPKSAAKKADLHADVMDAIEAFKTRDPGLQSFFDNAEGYAVFPSVGKGGIGVGGAYGKGELFENGDMVGYCDLSQGSIGFQLGGQVYSELIFFQDEASLAEFKAGTVEFSAQASAVALTAGASANADYQNGVAVFTIAKGGLMYEASIGGQGFDYVPK